MANLNVAVLGAPEYAKGIGKKSTASDITFYDVKTGDVTVSLVEPTKYPDKLAPLFYATSLADVALVIVDELGPTFGETALMLDCLDVKEGLMVLRNYITPEQVKPLTKGTALEHYEVVPDDPLKLKERLMARAGKVAPEAPSAKGQGGSVPIDHYFDVKGVGTVVLGCVAEGVVRKHDALRVLPSDKQAEIRSIQKHDDDFDWAVKSDRVGLALKGVSVDDLDRGTVLTTNGSVTGRPTLTGRAHLIKYWPRPLSEGMVLHIGHWMQFEPGRIESIEKADDWRSPRVRISMSKELVCAPGSKAILTQLEGTKLRIVGTMDLL